MTSLFSYLITMFGGMFWLFRVVVTLTYSLEISFPILPINFSAEVVLLFVAIVCMIFIVKRNIVGTLVYFAAYGIYFGNDLYNGVMNIISGQALEAEVLSIFISLIGVIIPFLTVMDIFLNKERRSFTFVNDECVSDLVMPKFKISSLNMILKNIKLNNFFVKLYVTSIR